MNLLVFRPGQRQGETLTATVYQSQHIREILKAQPGERPYASVNSGG